MRIFGYSNEFYAVDNQLIYPHVFFLSEHSILGKRTIRYRRCFTILKTHLNLVILPENDTEFNVLIMKKFARFLKEIEIASKNAVSKKLSISAFEEKVRQAIKQSNFGDFKKYWEINKSEFRNWLSLDPSLREGEKFKMVRLALEKYREITEGFRQEWKKEDENLCNDFYNCLKLNRQQETIPSEVDDRDLQILSGCLTFVCSYLPYGILYLVTDDKALFDTGKMVANAKISFQNKKLRLAGFDTVKPIDVLIQFKKKMHK